MKKSERPKVGVGVYVVRDGKFLMGERQGAHGANTYSAPGGHLENGESWEACAIRETLEETGLEVKNVRFLGVTNDIFDAQKHYITISVVADWCGGEPERCEPDKCLGWEWVDLENLPEKTFLPFENLMKSEFVEDLKRELEA